MTRLRPRLLIECNERNPTMFTKEGYVKFVLSDAKARMMVDAGIITAEQVILSQLLPMLEVPKLDTGIPRNRHERRRLTARKRRS